MVDSFGQRRGAIPTILSPRIGRRFEDVVKQNSTNHEVIVHLAPVDHLCHAGQAHAEFVQGQRMFDKATGIIVVMPNACWRLLNRQPRESLASDLNRWVLKKGGDFPAKFSIPNPVDEPD